MLVCFFSVSSLNFFWNESDWRPQNQAVSHMLWTWLIQVHRVIGEHTSNLLACLVLPAPCLISFFSFFISCKCNEIRQARGEACGQYGSERLSLAYVAQTAFVFLLVFDDNQFKLAAISLVSNANQHVSWSFMCQVFLQNRIQFSGLKMMRMFKEAWKMLFPKCIYHIFPQPLPLSLELYHSRLSLLDHEIEMEYNL